MTHWLMKYLMLLTILIGCSSAGQTLGKMERFEGQALQADGSPLENVLIVLQPLGPGYDVEMETNADGKFEGEAVPGRYVYYFADSKKGNSKLPKSFPEEYRDPRMEHVVTVAANQSIVCKADAVAGK